MGKKSHKSGIKRAMFVFTLLIGISSLSFASDNYSIYLDSTMGPSMSVIDSDISNNSDNLIIGDSRVTNYQFGLGVEFPEHGVITPSLKFGYKNSFEKSEFNNGNYRALFSSLRKTESVYHLYSVTYYNYYSIFENEIITFDFSIGLQLDLGNKDFTSNYYDVSDDSEVLTSSEVRDDEIISLGVPLIYRITFNLNDKFSIFVNTGFNTKITYYNSKITSKRDLDQEDVDEMSEERTNKELSILDYRGVVVGMKYNF